MVLPDDLCEYDTGEWKQLAGWIGSLHGMKGRVYRWTWYQLFVDYHPQFPGSGPWYHQSSKTWKAAAIRPTHDLTKCVRWFISYLLRIAKKLGTPLPTKHMRPDSSILAFWSNNYLDSSNFGRTATTCRRMVLRVDHVFRRSQGAGSCYFNLATNAGRRFGASKHPLCPLRRDCPERSERLVA